MMGGPNRMIRRKFFTGCLVATLAAVPAFGALAAPTAAPDVRAAALPVHAHGDLAIDFEGAPRPDATPFPPVPELPPAWVDARTGVGGTFPTGPIRIPSIERFFDAPSAEDEISAAYHCPGFCFTTSTNYSRTAPFDAIGVTDKFNASSEGLVLRLEIKGPISGYHNYSLQLRQNATGPATGDLFGECGGFFVVPPVIVYTGLAILCTAQNEGGEEALRDLKMRGGSFSGFAYYDGNLTGMRNLTFRAPGLRVGMDTLMPSFTNPLNGATDSHFWWYPLPYATNWTINNTGNSTFYAPASSTRNVRLDVFANHTGGFLPPGVFAPSRKDFTDFGWALHRVTAYANNLPPKTRYGVDLSWTPVPDGLTPGSKMPENPYTFDWRGLGRLTANYWLTSPWYHVPKVVEVAPGNRVHFYADSVNPDDPGWTSDKSGPAALYLAEQAKGVHDNFTAAFGLTKPPASANGNTIMSVRKGVNACGIASYEALAVYCYWDPETTLHVYAMEYHHSRYQNYMSLLDAVKPGASGPIEGCAEVGQELVNQTWKLKKDLGSISAFVDRDLGRDPYFAEVIPDPAHLGNYYGSSYFLCQMWMDVRGAAFQETMANTFSRLDAPTAYWMWQKASGVDSRLGAQMWRWYVSDRTGKTPTFPLTWLAATEPIQDVGAGSLYPVAIGDLDPGKVLTSRYRNFSSSLTYSVTTAPLATGGADTVVAYGFDSSGNGGKGKVHMIAGTAGSVIKLPWSWTDSPDDRVGVAVLHENDPWFVGTYPVTISLAVTGGWCVPGRPC